MPNTLKVQEFTKDQVVDQIERILNFIHQNKKYSSSKQIATTTNTSIFLVQAVISGLTKLSYIQPIFTPTGKLKDFSFDFYCQGVVFFSAYYILYNGRLVAGCTRRTASSMPDAKQQCLRYKDIALNEGLKFVEYRISHHEIAKDLFFDIFVKKEVLESVLVEAMPIRIITDIVPELVDIFNEFPLCKKEIDFRNKQVDSLQKQLHVLQENDKELKSEFEKQNLLAQCGKRVKTVTESKIIGKEDVYLKTVRSSSDMYGDSVEHLYESCNVYEHTNRTVVDFPKNPIYHQEEILELIKKINEYQMTINYIEKNLYYYEKRLTDDEMKKHLKIDYEQKQLSLTKEYKEKLKILG